jgi:hypothetical protein
MPFRKAVLFMIALLAGLTLVEARSKGKRWDEPFQGWSRDQVKQLFDDSPWAQAEKVSSTINTRNAGETGEKDLFYTFTARFFSALPVREGYVRLYQLLNHYDAMSAAEKQQFDSKFKRALDLDTSKTVIVALEFNTNDPQAARDVMDFLHTSTTQSFKQTAYLVSQRLGRVELQEYYPPSTDGTGAKFVFPRLVNGQPVVSPSDRDVRVDIHIPLTVFSRSGLSASPDPDPDIVQGAAGSVSARVDGPPVNRQAGDSHILLTFDVGKMTYEGKLSY